VTLAADLLRALDPVALAGQVGMIPDPWQAEVLRSTKPRILLNCCRQSGKSTTAAMLAVHVATYEPGSLVLLLSPSQRQSAELLRKAMAFYRSLGRPEASEAENAMSLTSTFEDRNGLAGPRLGTDQTRLLTSSWFSHIA
jgi:hypothetical protein